MNIKARGINIDLFFFLLGEVGRCERRCDDEGGREGRMNGAVYRKVVIASGFLRRREVLGGLSDRRRKLLMGFLYADFFFCDRF